MRFLIGVLALLFACGGCDKEEPANSPKSDSPMSCTRDEECQAPPCGPCTAGTPLTPDMMTQTCVVNPCPQALAHCNADGAGGNKVCALKCVACANAPTK